MFKQIGQLLDSILVSVVVCYLLYSFYLKLLSRQRKQQQCNQNLDYELNLV